MGQLGDCVVDRRATTYSKLAGTCIALLTRSGKCDLRRTETPTYSTNDRTRPAALPNQVYRLCTYAATSRTDSSLTGDGKSFGMGGNGFSIHATVAS